MAQNVPNRTGLSASFRNNIEKFHIARMSWAIVVIIIGGIAVALNNKDYSLLPVTATGIATLFAGVLGIAAARFNSMALHAGCIGSSALSLWIGYGAYQFCLVNAATPAIELKNDGLILTSLYAVVLELVFSASVIGMEAVALHIDALKSRISLTESNRYEQS